jgi:hypothetical protein
MLHAGVDGVFDHGLILVGRTVQVEALDKTLKLSSILSHIASRSNVGKVFLPGELQCHTELRNCELEQLPCAWQHNHQRIL